MKKKITKIILAVCLVVAGLPLFAIGARANDDANTNSEMMISVDNYFDYRNAKLMTASFGAGYTADSMDYPALVCNATCLGCGYVGNISIGLMSMGDKLS